jgi:hypothetical protein
MFVSISSMLAGCANLPAFTGPPGSAFFDPTKDSVPTVSEVVRHIQCEIWSLPKPSKEGAGTPEQEMFAPLWRYQYVVYGNLTVDVTDNGSVNPSLDFIEPLSTAMTSVSLALNSEIGLAGHRNITLSFVLDLDPAGNPTFNPGKGPDGHFKSLDQYCQNDEKPLSGIKGDLGIRDIVAEGLQHTLNPDFVFPLAIAANQLDKLGLATSSYVPSFGSTVDFTLTYGLGGGPVWTLTHFVGPSGNTLPLLNYLRTRKETLVLAFAAAQQRNIALGDDYRKQGNAAGAAAAVNSATLNILQRLFPLSR